MDWETLTFRSTNPVRSLGTYIGIYVDNDFVSAYLLENNNNSTERIYPSKNDA